jgi:Domain of Unknown Function (DUF1080)
LVENLIREAQQASILTEKWQLPRKGRANGVSTLLQCQNQPFFRRFPMPRAALFFFALVLAGVWTCPSRGDAPAGFKALFNGKDLTGWKATGKMDVWGADAARNVLFVQGGGGGWLMTEEEYGDFELRLEYKMPKMGNSGVGLRSPLVGDPAYAGMEIQLLDDANWKGLRPAQHTGSIYDVVAAAEVNSKPFGEWNTMRIVAKGRNILVEHNGKKLVYADLGEQKEHFKRHPGLTRAQGHIGLQSYNFRVEFKNIYLKPL